MYQEEEEEEYQPDEQRDGVNDTDYDNHPYIEQPGSSEQSPAKSQNGKLI